MSIQYKKKINKCKMPKEFKEQVIKTVTRIEESHNVVGVLYLSKDAVQMYTLPETIAQVLCRNLPPLNASMQRAVTEISAKINNINPVIDRIMEDESVEGVIMTNKDGCPIMTNVNAAGATNYALALHRFGVMVQTCVKEMDPFDAVLVMRLHTKKKEIMVVPDPSFNIIVLQQARQKIKKNSEKQFIS